MAKKLPLFVGRQPSSEVINSELPEFRWEELCDKEEIGRGSFGAVFTAYFQALSISRLTAVIHQFWPRRAIFKLFRFLQKNKRVFVFVGGLRFRKGSSFS